MEWWTYWKLFLPFNENIFFSLFVWGNLLYTKETSKILLDARWLGKISKRLFGYYNCKCRHIFHVVLIFETSVPFFIVVRSFFNLLSNFTYHYGPRTKLKWKTHSTKWLKNMVGWRWTRRCAKQKSAETKVHLSKKFYFSIQGTLRRKYGLNITCFTGHLKIHVNNRRILVPSKWFCYNMNKTHRTNWCLGLRRWWLIQTDRKASLSILRSLPESIQQRSNLLSVIS